VLVVEDNPVNRKIVVALLTKWGHRVVVACDGARGLEALEREAFDLVLMDIQMPVMDGIAATRSIRARELEQGGHVSIIAITAHAGVQDRVRCLEAGVDRYLTKPMSSKLLRQAIDELFPAGGAEPDAAPAEASGGGVDFDQLKEFVGDDPTLLAEVVQIFLDDTPVTLETLVRAIVHADSAALEASAHRLKGSLSTMGAAAAAETANLLESMGRDGALAGAAELFKRLKREVGVTGASLRRWQGRLAA
jgi:CheY-like chemotaxis protein/HPt (histidine-containing phosphotransfer) domain-containing protein